MKKALFLLVVLLSSTSGITGCTRFSSDSDSTSNQNQEIEVTLESLLATDDVIAVYKDSQIVLVDPTTARQLPVYTPSTNQTIIDFNLFDIKVSPNNKYLVWYSPLSGFVSLDLSSQTARQIHPANEWLNINPYFSFNQTQDIVYFVDDQGTKLHQVNLVTGNSTSITIPFPFGNLFEVSPDGNYLLFVSAYDANATQPEFMITNNLGENPIRFKTNGPLNKREYVEWLPDSSGIISLSSTDELFFHPVDDPSQTRVFYKHPQPLVIDSLYRVENILYFYASDGKWYEISTEDKTLIGAIPQEIAVGLKRPVFFPWIDQQFLIVETIKELPLEYDRLWLTNQMGARTLVMDQFNQIQVDVLTPEL